MNRSRSRASTALLAALLAGALATPAVAAPGGRKGAARQESTTTTTNEPTSDGATSEPGTTEPSPTTADGSTSDAASTSSDRPAPTIHDEVVGLPGSLYEVARAMGLGAADAPTGKGVGIALIDTGVTDVAALRHSNITIGPDFSFDAPNPKLVGRDANGHGTHLAGLIASTDAAWAAGDHRRVPGRQIGVAPDAHVVSVKVGAANGAVDVSQVIAAVNWVVDHQDEHGIRVLSLAYGTDSTQDPEIDPLSYAVERAWHAGIFVVVGAGNDGLASSSFVNPAANDWIATAGATGVFPDGSWVKDGMAAPATFASGAEGYHAVEIVAPGTSIVGPRVVGSVSDHDNERGRVGSDLVKGSGTSQATALIAGAAAALLEARPELTPAQVRLMLTGTGLPVEGDSSYTHAGAVQVDAAMEDPGVHSKGKWRNQPYELSQNLRRGTGTGTLDAARGTHRVSIDGVAISGEIDVFAQDWSPSTWTQDAFTSASWNGASWNGASWNGASWNNLSWTGASWNNLGWNGASWNSADWNSASWNGASWNGASWNGASWNGASWNGIGWNGTGWNGAGWS